MRLSVARRVGLVVALGLGVHAAAAQAQVTVGGLVYSQFGYSLKPDSGLVATTGSAGHDNNFDVTRAYVNLNAKFADGVSARITSDIDSRGLSFGGTSETQLTLRLKYAFVAWQPDAKGPLTYKFGLMQTPWIDWEESLWDYRMQGTVAFDRNKLFPASDFGAGIDGSWNYDQVNMQVGVYDGEGYSATPGDPGKDVEGRLSYRLAKTDMAGRSGGLRITGYAQLGDANGGGTRTRFIGNLAYKSKAVTLAAEIGVGQDSINATHPKQKQEIISAYGVYNIPRSKVALIGRVDTFDPNTDSTGTATGGTVQANNAGNVAVNKQTRFIGGISYAISPNLRVLLDIDTNSLENGATNAFDKNRSMLFFHTEAKF
ncbi:MAG TPA: hypothetical protein VGL65_01075 [Gemmatimonadales bacterium]|jgi:predicted porin